MRTISRKLILAFLLVAVIAAVLVAVIIRLTSPERLNVLLRDQARSQLESLLVDYYTVHGSFDGVITSLEASGFIPASHFQGQPGQPLNPGPASNRLIYALADEHGRVILTMLPEYPLGAALSVEQLASGRSIQVNGRVVGTILIPSASFTLTLDEQAFLDRTNQAVWLAAIGAILVALVTGIVLAGTFARPVRALTSAARRMADGELDQEVPVSSKDEIGQLTQAFNSMSRAVSKSNELRRQMTADVAHDLRTPLTVIAGYVESMQEGMLAPTTERLNIIRLEIERLQHMVDDLRTISHAEAGELTLVCQPIAPRALLERIAAVYQHAAEQKGIILKSVLSGEIPTINVDEARMMQVISNLIDNALRYTSSGGTITLDAQQVENAVSLCVQDTGSGIQPDVLPHIFERFYRADKSRAEADGGSGLGLAIARALVILHGGELHAESTPGLGTKMTIDLPV